MTVMQAQSGRLRTTLITQLLGRARPCPNMLAGTKMTSIRRCGCERMCFCLTISDGVVFAPKCFVTLFCQIPVLLQRGRTPGIPRGGKRECPDM